ncbi:MAG: endonuclease/exonuclease/phosphatase family protein [Armatimonadetes bacterium]|nr:endonuclease/exonuclease/phosphatase family protein [Armatimonadota bacterium]
MELRVMTFNIRNGLAEDGPNGWEFRKHKTAETIRQASPDVFGLQEVFDFQLDYLVDQLSEYECYSIGRNDGQTAGEHCSILWRKGVFHRADAGTFWFSDEPEAPGSMTWGNQITRICSWVDLAEGFRFLNVHLDHAHAESRRKSVDLLLNRLPTTPWILAGDFNAEPEWPEMKALSNSSKVELVTATNKIGTFHNFGGGIGGERIDHIVLPVGTDYRDTQVIVSETEIPFPSDHYPVVSTVKIS